MFTGKQEAVDATLAALEVVGEPLKSMAYMLVDVCAYAGEIAPFVCSFMFISEYPGLKKLFPQLLDLQGK